MEKRKLGTSGPEVSPVGLGCNNFGVRIDLEASRRVIHKAIDLGITLFDTADIYGMGGSETCWKVLGTAARHRAGDQIRQADGRGGDARARRGATSCRRSRPA